MIPERIQTEVYCIDRRFNIVLGNDVCHIDKHRPYCLLN